MMILSMCVRVCYMCMYMYTCTCLCRKDDDNVFACISYTVHHSYTIFPQSRHFHYTTLCKL